MTTLWKADPGENPSTGAAYTIDHRPTGGSGGPARDGLRRRGVLAAHISHPDDLVLVTAGAVAALLATYAGLLPVLVVLLVLVPSAPVGIQIAGHDWTEVRTAGLILLCAALLVAYWRDLRLRLPTSVRLGSIALAALVPVGVAAALDTSHGSTDLLKALSQAVGQPFSYAVLLGAFGLALRGPTRSRRWLFAAWGAALVIQAGVSVGQLISGSAFDPSLGYDRASGTMGSDFLGAFALLSLFVGLYVRATASGRAERLIATAFVLVAGLTLVASLSRSALIALAVGIAVLVVRAIRARGGFRSLRPLLLVLAATAVGLFLTRGIWTQRLSTNLTFDRPATWVSGWRIGVDHPWTGVGPNHVVQLVTSDIRYGYTSYGATYANPSDTWIFAVSAEGFPYALVLLLASAVIVGVLLRAPPSPAESSSVSGCGPPASSSWSTICSRTRTT